MEFGINNRPFTCILKNICKLINLALTSYIIIFIQNEDINRQLLPPFRLFHNILYCTQDTKTTPENNKELITYNKYDT